LLQKLPVTSVSLFASLADRLVFHSIRRQLLLRLLCYAVSEDEEGKPCKETTTRDFLLVRVSDPQYSHILSISL
jgi:hypothetical protein